MISKTRWLVKQLLSQIWVRAVLIGLLGVVAALIGTAAGYAIPDRWGDLVGADAVDQILGILASSMLAVVTFSLAVAVQAFSAASTNATPRAIALLQQDTTTQTVLSIFLGGFLFALVGIIALSIGIYGGGGRLILFGATLLVVTLVVGALIHWIQHLMHFGRMEDILDRVEDATAKALKAHACNPWLGGIERRDDPPETAATLVPSEPGFIQLIDIEALNSCASEADRIIWIDRLPGSFAYAGEPLLHISGGPIDEAMANRLRKAFSIGRSRSFDSDPRFGLLVLSEIASRALSPGINDPGTAIDVIARLLRSLSHYSAGTPSVPACTRVHVPSLRPEDIITDSFASIARDGAAMVEVQIRLQNALASLAAQFPTTLAHPARHLAQTSRTAALPQLHTDFERAALSAAEAPDSAP